MNRLLTGQVPAKLIGSSGSYLVRLRLTATEVSVDEIPGAAKRILVGIEPVSPVSAPDGSYSLHFESKGFHKHDR